METKTTIKVLGFKMYANNNYTCTSEQNMLQYEYKPTLCKLAEALDDAQMEARERVGYSGAGAGAYVMAVLQGENGETIESEIHSLNNDLVSELEHGSDWHLRRYRGKMKKSQYWDGHNFIRPITYNSDQVLS